MWKPARFLDLPNPAYFSKDSSLEGNMSLLLVILLTVRVMLQKRELQSLQQVSIVYNQESNIFHYVVDLFWT